MHVEKSKLFGGKTVHQAWQRKLVPLGWAERYERTRSGKRKPLSTYKSVDNWQAVDRSECQYLDAIAEGQREGTDESCWAAVILNSASVIRSAHRCLTKALDDIKAMLLYCWRAYGVPNCGYRHAKHLFGPWVRLPFTLCMQSCTDCRVLQCLSAPGFT